MDEYKEWATELDSALGTLEKCRKFIEECEKIEKDKLVEPKVLTTREAWAKICSTKLAIPWLAESTMLLGEAMHQNGRLEMWLEFREYLEDKKCKERASISHFSLEKAIESLTPEKK